MSATTTTKRVCHEQIKKQLSDLLAVLDAHETESFQCDRKEATYCDCLTRSKMAAKAALAAAEKDRAHDGVVFGPTAEAIQSAIDTARQKDAEMIEELKEAIEVEKSKRLITAQTALDEADKTIASLTKQVEELKASMRMFKYDENGHLYEWPSEKDFKSALKSK
jgi:predicted RNase H-like nuclease (RuvC/YqgF family)